MNNYFILHADCKLVDGYNRSIIYDLTRESFSFIPNALYEILSEDFELTIQQITTKYGEEHKTIILEYFDFLIEKEYLYFTEDPEERSSFPAISTQYESPYVVTNVIIDYDAKVHPINLIVAQLEMLGSVHLQLRFYSKKLLNQLDTILETTVDSRIKSIELVMPEEKSIEMDLLLENHLRIQSVILHTSQQNEVQTINGIDIQKTKTSLSSAKCCGQIQMGNFSINLPFFNETAHYNNCLNKKIAIDTNGNIKNCPSMKLSYGNIEEVSLKKVAENAIFQELWSIDKASIETCKGCEFRNMCLDCRAYIEDPKDIYSKPLKCGYDPKTNKWEDWSINPLKKEAITYYNLQ